MTELEKLAIGFARSVDNLDKIITALGIGTDGFPIEYKQKLNRDYQQTKRDLDSYRQKLIVYVCNNNLHIED